VAAPLIVAASAGLIGGCGFNPVFGQFDDAGTEHQLAQIQIGPIEDRVGQILRNQLMDDVTPLGQPREPRYRLEVKLRESTSVLAIRKNEVATLANLNLSAQFVLISMPGNMSVFSNSVRVVSSYNILTSDYGTVAAEKDAREKAAKALSGDIKNRLISYFLRANQQARSGSGADAK
jgi:LPS-assembly lipoprotein